MMRITNERSTARTGAGAIALKCIAVSILPVLGAVQFAPATAASLASDKPIKILFIGDSFTAAQGGIDMHVQRLSETAMTPHAILVDRVTTGGASLKGLWEIGDAKKAIDTDKYSVVVIQDDIPEINVPYFRQYARLFVDEARMHHARPVLYMAWAYERLDWISMEQIAQAHRSVAHDLGVDVAPIGLARQDAHSLHPEVDMFVDDREHPSLAATYLGACVIYATLFGKDPSGAKYIPDGVTADQATFLQRIAWGAVLDWRETLN
jgi:hypothetical protein